VGAALSAAAAAATAAGKLWGRMVAPALSTTEQRMLLTESVRGGEKGAAGGVGGRGGLPKNCLGGQHAIERCLQGDGGRRLQGG
jgi:hypothetical protein